MIVKLTFFSGDRIFFVFVIIVTLIIISTCISKLLHFVLRFIYKYPELQVMNFGPFCSSNACFWATIREQFTCGVSLVVFKQMVHSESIFWALKIFAQLIAWVPGLLRPVSQKPFKISAPDRNWLPREEPVHLLREFGFLWVSGFSIKQL